MPLSEKQLAANRANAHKSRGPITPGDRRNSSHNALKHGMFAQTILLPGESRERFLKLFADLTTEFQATTTGASSAAGPSRPPKSVANSTSRATPSRTKTSPPNPSSPSTPSTSRRAFSKPSRQEIRFDRQYHRATDRLLRPEKGKKRGTNLGIL